MQSTISAVQDKGPNIEIPLIHIVVSHTAEVWLDYVNDMNSCVNSPDKKSPLLVCSGTVNRIPEGSLFGIPLGEIMEPEEAWPLSDEVEEFRDLCCRYVKEPS